jgi:hypothetical protein
VKRTVFYFFLPLSRLVVYTLTGDLALTLRASFKVRWLRLVPVRRGVVRFFGLPKGLTPKVNLNKTKSA